MLFIAINDFLTTKQAEYMKWWMIIMICINNIFLIELLVDFVLNGSKAYKNRLRVWFETVCQIVNIYGMISFF